MQKIKIYEEDKTGTLHHKLTKCCSQCVYKMFRTFAQREGGFPVAMVFLKTFFLTVNLSKTQF